MRAKNSHHVSFYFFIFFFYKILLLLMQNTLYGPKMFIQVELKQSIMYCIIAK